jgi:hypothetical protein
MATRRGGTPLHLIVWLMSCSLLAACGATASPSLSASIAVPSTRASAEVSGPPTTEPSVTASPAPTPKATPKPTPVAKWTDPKLVSTKSCGSVRAGVDATGRSHLVASCGNALMYAVTRPDGSWTQTSFALPANRLEQDPQLAFRGNLVFMAYSRLSVDVPHDCGGDDGLTDIGVFYRTRTLPDGAWSKPFRIAEADDHLQQFRVDGPTIHAIVRKEGDNRGYYLNVSSARSQRVVVPNAAVASLQVDSDGRARIAYAATGSIWAGTFEGSRFSTTKFAAPDAQTPGLVLDAGNGAHVIWARWPFEEGCGTFVPDPAHGMYYATNATGAWQSEQVTHDRGEWSFEVDPATGQVHFVLASDGLTYYTKAPGGTWQREKLPTTSAQQTVIARDPRSGRLLVVYIAFHNDAPAIYAIAKG